MANPILVAAILRAATSLPGVHDEGHLRDYAEGTASAVEAATCAGDWVQDPDCRPVWAGSQNSLAAALVTKAWFESGFVARIARGQCRPLECDAYKDLRGVVHHRSRGYYQIQQTGAVGTREWREMLGTGYWAVFTASSVAARLLGGYQAQCKTIAGTFAGYATGGRCSWSRVAPRVKAYERTLAVINTPPGKFAAARRD